MDRRQEVASIRVGGWTESGEGKKFGWKDFKIISVKIGLVMASWLKRIYGTLCFVFEIWMDLFMFWYYFLISVSLLYFLTQFEKL